MPSNARKLEGKIAVVTGASRGIGREIAAVFAAEGAQVIATARQTASLEELAAAIRASGGLEPFLCALDVKDAAKIAEFWETVLDKYGRVDILVNNAGVTKDGLFVRMSEADWDEVLDTNLKGTFLCMRAAAKAMMKQRSGKIINIASVIGLIGNSGQANYAASKAGIIALTKSVAKELGSRNVLVNAIAPGFIETEMTAKLGEDVRQAVLKTIPTGTFGKASDVAKAAVFLASSESDFITGQVVTVDGGMVM
jgi:3-oxoacyl-[acyl-carrier protein] reductase